jgi:AcrR family transcriptional regulator
VPEPKPLRADARRNRDRILAVATEAFAEDGADASLDAIARRAGVGSGTLYRHFPTRESLIIAVYRARLDEACARGTALRGAPDPVAALAGWLRVLVGLSTRDGVTATLLGGRTQWPQGFADEAHSALSAVGEPLLARARPALRPDLTLDELHALVHGIATASNASDAPRERADRLLALVLDGLRSRSDQEG